MLSSSGIPFSRLMVPAMVPSHRWYPERADHSWQRLLERDLRVFAQPKYAMSRSLEAWVCSLGVRGRSLVVLPAHFGRLRGLSHEAFAPVGRVAANEAADNVVYKIFQRLPEFQEADSYCSSFDKHARCGRYGETTKRDYSKEWRMMSANSWSKTVITLSLGREWLSIMPCYPPLVFEPHAR